MREVSGRKILFGALVATAFWAVVFVLTSDVASHYEICETTREGAKSCARYGVVSFALREVGIILDSYNGLITAIATGFIAWFTFSLRQSTDRLWDAANEQARVTENGFTQLEGPVIEGNDITLDLIQGPPRDSDSLPTIKFWLKNRGRGPGFIVRVSGQFVTLPKGEIPPIPRYRNPRLSNMALAAGEQTSNALEFVLERPDSAADRKAVGLLFYGYVEYRGVFGGVSTWAWGFQPGNDGAFAIAGGTAYNYRKYEPDRKE